MRSLGKRQQTKSTAGQLVMHVYFVKALHAVKKRKKIQNYKHCVMIESAELNYTYSETAQIHPNTHTQVSTMHKTATARQQIFLHSKSRTVLL